MDRIVSSLRKSGVQRTWSPVLRISTPPSTQMPLSRVCDSLTSGKRRVIAREVPGTNPVLIAMFEHDENLQYSSICRPVAASRST